MRAWYTEARRANWRSPQNIKAAYRTARILRNNRVVFNIKGNAYRLVIAVQYDFQVVYIRFVGTHVEYDKIKAEEVWHDDQTHQNRTGLPENSEGD